MIYNVHLTGVRFLHLLNLFFTSSIQFELTYDINRLYTERKGVENQNT